MKKKSVIKLLSLSLCGVLAATSITMFAHAGDANVSGKDNAPATSFLSLQENPIINLSAGEESSYKDETVYVLTNADGSVSKVVVSDWLKNGLGETAIKDVTNLDNVENVKGDETFTKEQDFTYWNAQGRDIYYQGTTTQSLPVDVTVTYLLDGKKVTPEELKGKSGHVTIRYEFKNNQYELMEIDGKEEKVYVPFAMLTGLMLNDEKFTNVEVAGGRLINDGSRTIVAGVSFPGMQENLKLDAETVTIPDSLEIQADVSDFELSGAVIIATNEIFNRVNLDGVTSMEDLEDAMDQLTDAMNQLMNGSSQLSDGLLELKNKSGDLSDGVSKLADGSFALYNGAGQLNDGAGQLQSGASQLQGGAAKLQNGAAQLQNGATQLSSGLDTLVANNESLNGGARQVFNTLLSTAQSQLMAAGLSVPDMTVENYQTVLNGVIASLDENAVYAQALQAVTNAVNAQSDLIREKVTAAIRAEVEKNVTEAVRAQVTAQVIQSATGMDCESYQNAVAAGMIPEENQAAISAAIDAQMVSEEVKQIIAATVDAKMAEDSIQSLIESTVAAQIQQAITDNMNSPEVQGQLAAASAGAQSVLGLKASLDSYNAFYCGLQAYTAGVAQAATGASQLSDGAGQLSSGAGQLSAGAGQLSAGAGSLKDGTQKLYDGAKQLNDRMNELKDSMPALLNGIEKLYDGSTQLRDGLSTFNDEGIQKLVNAVDGNLEGLVNRLKATMDASKQYRNFSGISDEADGQVKFIYRISGINK